MLETIAVLFIFFILIMLGIVFYANVIRGNIQIQQEETVQLNAIEVAQRASSLPELQCSEDNIVSDNCIDILKLDSAEGIILANDHYYYDRFFFSTITIKEIYPDNTRSWRIYNRPLAVDKFSNKIRTDIPISLFDPINNKNSFGMMTVELFST